MPLRRVSWACLIGAYVTASTGLISKPGLADNGFSPVQRRIEQLREEYGIPGASVAVIEDGTIDTVPWITHRLAFDEVSERFEGLIQPDSGVLKAIIEVTD